MYVDELNNEVVESAISPKFVSSYLCNTAFLHKITYLFYEFQSTMEMPNSEKFLLDLLNILQ